MRELRIRKRYSRNNLAIDLTPMADMVLLLLIFFMLSSSFLVEPGINLKLPKTKTAEIQTENKIVVSIKDTGEIFLNNKEIKLEELEYELRSLLPLQKDRIVIIRADKESKHGIVVKVLDKAKIAGAEKLAIATEAETK
ncbi:MAG: ExbD/TolR family protein [Endomicrobiia bacterium]